MPAFRTSFYKMLPWWLTNGEGELANYSLSILVDAFAQAHEESAKARFPTYAPNDALAHIGRDRKIVRGIDEPRDSYVARLKRWLDDHPNRGGPYALLTQAGAYWDNAPNGPYKLSLIYRSGKTFERDVDGTIRRTDPMGAFWDDVDAFPERWARWWLIFHWHEDPDDEGDWGDPGDYGDGGVWGSNLTPEEVIQLRLVPYEWNAAHCIGYIGILGPSSSLHGDDAADWASLPQDEANYIQIGLH